MKLHRNEIMFLGYLALLAGVGLLVYRAASDLEMLASSYTSGGIADALHDIDSSLKTLTWLMGAVVLAGLAGIYPTIRRNAQEHGRLSEATEKLTKKTETFQHAALTDPLTGLQNRRYFDDALDEYCEEFNAIGRPLGIIVLDLDHFKNINDTYGHDVGDDVLRGVTRCLLDYTRYHDVVARIGGEEFAILAPNLDMRSLNKLADRIRMAISEIVFNVDNVSLRVTTSMGIALWDGAEPATEFVKRADLKLYQAKADGRNRVAA